MLPASDAGPQTSDFRGRSGAALLGRDPGGDRGALVEFKEPEEIARRYPAGVRELRDGGVWGTLAGHPTDDSELALALARTLAGRKDYDAEAAAASYGRCYTSDPFDVGTTTRGGDVRGRTSHDRCPSATRAAVTSRPARSAR